jgi:hypothetical protein
MPINSYKLLNPLIFKLPLRKAPLVIPMVRSRPLSAAKAASWAAILGMNLSEVGLAPQVNPNLFLGSPVGYALSSMNPNCYAELFEFRFSSFFDIKSLSKLLKLVVLVLLFSRGGLCLMKTSLSAEAGSWFLAGFSTISDREGLVVMGPLWEETFIML